MAEMAEVISQRVYGSESFRPIPASRSRRATGAASAPQGLVAPVAQLQQTFGNQGVLRRLQAKLAINQPGDVYEQEADRVAEAVMSQPNPNSIGPLTISHAGASAPVRRKCTSCEEDEEVRVQRKESLAAPSGSAAPLVEGVLNSPGQPLDRSTRSFMETRFGVDFSGVRVHTDRHAADSASAVNALAYTVGRDVVFGASTYRPHTSAGRRLLAHELSHVVQQVGVHPMQGAGQMLSIGRGGSSRSHLFRKERVLVEEPAAGCGVCQPATRVGGIAHAEIQTDFVLPYILKLVPNVRAKEVPVPCQAYPKRPDLVLFVGEKKWAIGSIKPARASYYEESRKVHTDYSNCIRKYDPGASVFPMQMPAPSIVLPFPNPEVPYCPPQRFFINDPDEYGTYGYYCRPERSKLANLPNCQCDGTKVTKPLPLPFGAGRPQDKRTTAPAPVSPSPSYAFEIASRKYEGLTLEAAIAVLSEQWEILRNTVDRMSGEHELLGKRRQEPSFAGFAGFAVELAHGIQWPEIAMWEAPRNELRFAKAAIGGRDVAGAVEALNRAKNSYAETARRYLEYREGSLGAAERAADREIPAIAIATIALFILPSALPEGGGALVRSAPALAR